MEKATLDNIKQRWGHKMILKGWKVLSRNQHDSNGRRYLTSATVGNLLYRIGRWTRPLPGFGPLCVFKRREDAIMFNGGRGGVFRCLYEPSISSRVWNNNSFKPLWDMPDGKALARKVKVLHPAGGKARG